MIWKVRHFCCTFLPRLLPRIIDCVDYSNPQQVQQLHTILAKWPPLPVECAFQLLDYAYPDTFVRAFAVKCLRKNATDNDVLLYMLQLCQGKYCFINVIYDAVKENNNVPRCGMCNVFVLLLKLYFKIL